MIKKHYGLVGYPLAHSQSAEIFREIFRKERIEDSSYKLFPIGDIGQLHHLITSNTMLYGLNVTIPYKIKVIRMLDEIDDEASAIGAVNCISVKRHKGRFTTKGYNTDAPAFLQTLRPFLKRSSKKALIFGSGGSAMAVKHALNRLNIEWNIVSRAPGEGQLGYDDLPEIGFDEYQIFVNCTPVGMYPNSGQAVDFPFNKINEDHLLYDLVYNPQRTKFLESGAQMGARVISGYEMLQLQARMSWENWKNDH